MSRNVGSTKWRLRWGSFRGSSLNLEWSKRGVRLDDQWMFVSWLHIEDFFYACLGVVFIWDFGILIMLTDLSWLRIPMPWFFLCFIDIFVWDIDMLDHWWLILLHCLAYWFWFCHDCSDHFTCIHSPLYIARLDMLILWLVYYFDRLWAWCLYHYLSWLS